MPSLLHLDSSANRSGESVTRRLTASFADTWRDLHESGAYRYRDLVAADTVLIGAPMYNYSVPASLKAWIDRVAFPGAFTDPGTGDSLLNDTRVVVVSARGGAYGPGTPRETWDFQTPYLRAYLGKQGVAEENISFVSAELTLADLVPHLARFRSQAAGSLAAVTALATGATESANQAVS